jgi:hypothetical protein
MSLRERLPRYCICIGLGLWIGAALINSGRPVDGLVALGIILVVGGVGAISAMNGAPKVIHR